MDVHTQEIKRLQIEEVTGFRLQYSDTFAVLCKMHLSFILDLDKDGLAPFLETECAKDRRKRSQTHKKGRDETTKGTRLTFETAAPMQRLIRHLHKNTNLQEEGLFRKSGSISRQQTLKSLLRRNVMLDFDADGYSVHDCACTLKSMLLDLAEPLLTNAHFAAYCRIPGLYKEKALPSIKMQCRQKQLKAAQLLLLLLPMANYNIVKDLLLLLHGVSGARQENCMSSKSLATLFTPIILCPRQMSLDQMRVNYINNTKPVAFLIENAPVLFEYPEELVKDIILYMNQYRKGEAILSDRDTPPVKTSITFCIPQKNAEPVECYTQKALSELYDYVQGMPETMQKKYSKQVLNKENYASPVLKKQKHKRSKTLGDDVKEASTRATIGSYKYMPRRTSTGDIKVSVAKPHKEKATVAVNSSWRFLRKKQGENRENFDASPVAKAESRLGTPIRSTVLRASRRFKKAVKAHKHCRAHEL